MHRLFLNLIRGETRTYNKGQKLLWKSISIFILRYASIYNFRRQYLKSLLVTNFYNDWAVNSWAALWNCVLNQASFKCKGFNCSLVRIIINFPNAKVGKGDQNIFDKINEKNKISQAFTSFTITKLQPQT